MVGRDPLQVTGAALGSKGQGGQAGGAGGKMGGFSGFGLKWQRAAQVRRPDNSLSGGHGDSPRPGGEATELSLQNGVCVSTISWGLTSQTELRGDRGMECVQRPLGLEATPSQASLAVCSRGGRLAGRQGPRATPGDPGASGISLWSLSLPFSRKAPFCLLLPHPAGPQSGADVGNSQRTSLPSICTSKVGAGGNGAAGGAGAVPPGPVWAHPPQKSVLEGGCGGMVPAPRVAPPSSVRHWTFTKGTPAPVPTVTFISEETTPGFCRCAKL